MLRCSKQEVFQKEGLFAIGRVTFIWVPTCNPTLFPLALRPD
jgi:hypothetical protein